MQRLLPQVNAQRREQALRYKHTFGQFCCLKSWLMLSAMHIGDMEFLYNEHGIAVAIDDQPIGIDIEAIRHADEDLILRTMNEKEQARIREAVQTDRTFTRLWTQKEAILKMEGIGITSFEQLQQLSISDYRIQTTEKDKYIYSIAYGKLHCIGA